MCIPGREGPEFRRNTRPLPGHRGPPRHGFTHVTSPVWRPPAAPARLATMSTPSTLSISEHRARTTDPDAPGGGAGPRIAGSGRQLRRVRRRLGDLHTVVYDRRGYQGSRQALPAQHHAGRPRGRPPGRRGRSPVRGRRAQLRRRHRARRGARGRNSPILAVAAYEPPMPWLAVWPQPGPAPARRRGETRRTEDRRQRRPSASSDAWWATAHGTGCRRTGKRSRWADGPALAAELAAIRLDHPPFDVTSLGVPAVVRSGRRLGRPAPGRGGMAGRAHTRRRALRDRRRQPRRPPHPSRRIRRPGPRRAGPGRPTHRSHHYEHPRHRVLRSHRHRTHRAAVESDGHTVTRLVRGDASRRSAGTDVGWDPDAGTIEPVRLERIGTVRRRGAPGRGGHRRPAVVPGPQAGDPREPDRVPPALLVDTLAGPVPPPARAGQRVGRRLLRRPGRRGADRGRRRRGRTSWPRSARPGRRRRRRPPTPASGPSTCGPASC